MVFARTNIPLPRYYTFSREHSLLNNNLGTETPRIATFDLSERRHVTIVPF